MPVYGSTQIYLMEVSGALREAEALARVLEFRGYSILSVSREVGPLTGAQTYLITARASTTLYLDYLQNGELYQAGPYDGQEEAEAAKAKLLSEATTPVLDSYITAQRDHSRVYVGATNA